MHWSDDRDIVSNQLSNRLHFDSDPIHAKKNMVTFAWITNDESIRIPLYSLPSIVI
jgi:hypothetical protein